MGGFTLLTLLAITCASLTAVYGLRATDVVEGPMTHVHRGTTMRTKVHSDDVNLASSTIDTTSTRIHPHYNSQSSYSTAASQHTSGHLNDFLLCVVGAAMGSAGVLSMVGVVVKIVGVQRCEEIVVKFVTLNGLFGTYSSTVDGRKSQGRKARHYHQKCCVGGKMSPRCAFLAMQYSIDEGLLPESPDTPLSRTSSEASYVKRVREWDVLSPCRPYL